MSSSRMTSDSAPGEAADVPARPGMVEARRSLREKSVVDESSNSGGNAGHVPLTSLSTRGKHVPPSKSRSR
jgi:hypothetical protein